LAIHRIRDLFEVIKQGNYPSYTVKVQIMSFEDAKTYRFNPTRLDQGVAAQ
jgi:catalase